MTRSCTLYILAHLLAVYSPDQVQCLFLSSLSLSQMRTLRNGSRKDSRHIVTQNHNISSALKKWTMQTSERGSNNKRFQDCLDADENIPHWAIQGHSGGNSVDLSLQDNEQIPHDWMEHIHHVGSSISCSSKIRSGLIAGGKIGKDDKTVFFTAVDPGSEPQK